MANYGLYNPFLGQGRGRVSNKETCHEFEAVRNSNLLMNLYNGHDISETDYQPEMGFCFFNIFLP